MFLTKVTFLLFLPLCFSKPTEVTFKDVTFRGYSLFTEKFKKTITSSNSLKDFFPKSPFDKIEFVEQKIPVLYENSLADLRDLDELVIEFCEVEEIKPGAIKNAPLLRRLSLKGNKLTEIKTGVFNNLELSTLDLSNNSITTIESDAFNDLPNILNINLADNKISQWDKNWFKNTPLLTRISMQNNSISKLPNNAFRNLKGKKQFGKLTLTINLVLSYNKINEISPKAFSDLREINNLWLDNNLLETFDENLLENVNVKDLRLNNNKINCLNGDLSKILKADSTELDGNNMDCGCVNRIEKWKHDHDEKYVDIFYSIMNCSAQRIRLKLDALNKRLKEISSQNNQLR